MLKTGRAASGQRWRGLVGLLVVFLLFSGSGAPHATAQGGVKGGLAGAEFTRDVLPGGLVVLVEERPGSGLVAIDVAVLAGARYERGPTASAARFLERLFLAGTPTRPSRRDVLRAITARGGDLDVSAGWERVTLSAELAAEDLPVALDVLSDMLLNSLFARDRFEAERELVLQDLAEREDNPAALFADVAYGTVLGDPELRYVPSGNPETVARLTYEDLLRYRDEHVVRGNTIIAVVGDVRREEVLPQVAAAFAALPPGPRRAPRPIPPAPPAERVTRQAGSEQANVAVASRTPGVWAPERPALVLLSGLLGGGGQRLYEEIRDRRGLAYATGAGLLQMADVGVLIAYAGTDPVNTDEVTELLHAELARLRERPPSDDEVARTVAYFVNSQAVSLETNGARASDLVRREALYGVAPPRDYFLNLLRAVQPADVQRVAQRYLAPERLVTVVLGPDQ
jgi:predicted Zn-dependent peptidase